MAAADQKVRSGFSTIERETAEMNGSNYRDNVRQQATEKAEFEDAGLVFPPDRPLSGRGSGVSAIPPEGEEPPPAGGPKAPKPPVAKAKKVRARRRTNQTVELASGLSGRFQR